MNNTRLSQMFGLVILAAALATRAGAAEGVPDPGTQREFGAKLLVCTACHGDNGTPRSAAIPIIWGQQEDYLVKQLHDFQSGDRKVEVMAWMARTLTPDEEAPATAYFAKKNWPKQSAGTPSAPPPPGIAVCQSCHQQDFLGAPRAEGMATPRLAGQSYEYLVEAMRRFADGERTNNADMVQIMKAISPADREAMARYLSSL
jgi:cytochrome c553